jgi:hypothetical protein
MKVWRNGNEILVQTEEGALFVLGLAKARELRQELGKFVRARGWTCVITDAERTRRSERMKRIGHLGRSARKAKAAERRAMEPTP